MLVYSEDSAEEKGRRSREEHPPRAIIAWHRASGGKFTNLWLPLQVWPHPELSPRASSKRAHSTGPEHPLDPMGV
jgi:hypothetical protein